MSEPTESIKLADPIDVIRELFAAGWQAENGDLVLHCLNRIETKLTRYKAVEEAARELLAEYMYMAASLLGGRRPSWKHIGHSGREFWRADADNKIKSALDSDAGKENKKDERMD